jgi:hypothetical protein
MSRRDLCLAVSVEVVRLPSVWAFEPFDYAPNSVLEALDRLKVADEPDTGFVGYRPGEMAAVNAVLAGWADCRFGSISLGSPRPNRAQRRAR